MRAIIKIYSQKSAVFEKCASNNVMNIIALARNPTKPTVSQLKKKGDTLIRRVALTIHQERRYLSAGIFYE